MKNTAESRHTRTLCSAYDRIDVTVLQVTLIRYTGIVLWFRMVNLPSNFPISLNTSLCQGRYTHFQERVLWHDT